MTPAFDRKSVVKFKRNNVVFLATEEQSLELKHKLLVTGVALDAKEYEYKPKETSHEQHECENGTYLFVV